MIAPDKDGSSEGRGWTTYLLDEVPKGQGRDELEGPLLVPLHQQVQVVPLVSPPCEEKIETLLVSHLACLLGQTTNVSGMLNNLESTPSCSTL
jgi:hypothetical protein